MWKIGAALVLMAFAPAVFAQENGSAATSGGPPGTPGNGGYGCNHIAVFGDGGASTCENLVELSLKVPGAEGRTMAFQCDRRFLNPKTSTGRLFGECNEG